MTPWLSSNPLWENFAGRALFLSGYGGADFGEVRSTVERVGDGDRQAWHREWTATADRIEAIGDEAAAANRRVSAREAYIRAATYHRTAYYPFFGPTVNEQLASSSRREWEALQKLLPLDDPPAELFDLPFEGTRLTGVFVPAGDGRRPTLVCTNGYDSSVAEMFVAHALAAKRHGYHCLLFDGPGQGRPLIEQGLAMRPDWETVVGAVLDAAERDPRIDQDRMMLHGWSFGGYLSPRAATKVAPRLAALVADPGQWDMRASVLPGLPLSEERKAVFPDIDPAELRPLQDRLDSADAPPDLRWKLLQRGPLVHQVRGLFEYLATINGYEISSVVSGITCPTLVILAENDPVADQAEILFNAIPAKTKKLQRFVAAEGAGEHTQTTSRRLFHQRMYDWLDEVLGI